MARKRHIGKVAAMRALILLALILAGPAAAQPVGETLQWSVPPGYHPTRDERDGDWTTSAWRGASPWERLVRKIGRGGAIVAPIAVRDAMARNPLRLCTIGSIRDGHDNGYPYALWAASCRSIDGQLEEVWVKAIQGREAIYVVELAFAYNPEDADVTRWVAYLGRIQLCDPRLPDRPCRR
jgi:hypothetical protein